MSYVQVGRGTLIAPIVIEIAPLDTSATQASVPKPGMGGYNTLLREPVAGKDGSTTRKEGDLYRVEGQVLRQRKRFGRLQAQVAGIQNETAVLIGFHLCDLEAKGLIQEDGIPCLQIGDRMAAWYTLCDQTLIRTFTGDSQLFAVEVQDRGVGFNGNRNLLLVEFTTRDKSTVAGVR